MPTGFPSPYSPPAHPVQEPVTEIDLSVHTNPYLCALMCVSLGVFLGRGIEMINAGTFGFLQQVLGVIAVFMLVCLAWFIRDQSYQRCYDQTLREWLPYARLPAVPADVQMLPPTTEEKVLVARYRGCEDEARRLLHDLGATAGAFRSLDDVNARLNAAMRHKDTGEYRIRVQDHNRAVAAWQARWYPLRPSPSLS